MPIFNMPLTSAYGQNVKPYDGAKLYFFDAGTTTAKTTYTTDTEVTAHANPVVADANGIFAAIYLTGTFKARLLDKNDVQIWEEDNISARGGYFTYIGDFDSSTNSSNYPSTGFLGAAYRVSTGFTLASASGSHVLQTGDFIICNKNNPDAIDADWDIIRGRLIQNVGVKALTAAASIATDCDLGNVFTVTLDQASTLANPSNKVVGITYTWIITQDGIGSRTLAFGTDFDFDGGNSTIESAASEVCIIQGTCIAASGADSLKCKLFNPKTIKANTINEATSASGVTADGVLMKDFAITLNQDADAISLNFDSEATTADVINLDAATTTGIIVDINAEALIGGTAVDIADTGANTLTTGRLLNITSASNKTDTRSLVKITNDDAAATGATCLEIQQDSTADGIKVNKIGEQGAGNTGVTIDSLLVKDAALDFNTVAKGVFKGLECIIYHLPNDSAAGSLSTLIPATGVWTISDNIESVYYLGASTIVTVSSGIFTLGSTGYWSIRAYANFNDPTNPSVFSGIKLEVSNNGSGGTFNEVASQYTNHYAATADSSVVVETFLKTTATASDNCVKLATNFSSGTTKARGSSANNTYIVFTKLADL